MAAIGRNEPCPCGSGQKYKRCCALKAQKASLGSRIAISVIGLMLLTGAVYMFVSINDDDQALQPERVWSEEHGHWH